MKRIILSACLLISASLYAQVPEDAIRYSFYPQNGTARNLAIGGAMGSLGGDINATFVNPAGLGFYKTNEFVFTPGFFMQNNKASYRDRNTENKNNNFLFGSSGMILGFAQRNNPNKSAAISLAFTQTANFNSHTQYRGLNNFSSFSEQFAEEFAKSGYSIDDVLNGNSPLPYTSAPALYTYLIDTVKVNGVYQVKGAPEYILDAGQALMQEMDQKTKGAISELALGLAHNSNDKWYIGLSIGLPLVQFNSVTRFSEYDTSSNTGNHFNRFDYTDDFSTTGMGLNGRLGVIYRPRDYIRLGLSVQTPTYFSFTDKRSTTLSTQLENPVNGFSTSSNTFTNNQPGKVEYDQRSPFKVLLSASYVFREIADVKKQRAFITADVEYVHHRGSKFVNTDDNATESDKVYYKALNNTIKSNYKGNFNFRLGGELKFNVIMGRLGFAYYGNPYKDAALKASRILLSGGLGYRNKGFFIDLTYVHMVSKDTHVPYRLEDRANTYATVKQQKGNIVATVGIKF
ncbi:MAG: hypothetical protein IPP31_10250 [Chitinophagaceae bacterium]|nr:hypothetical protein [Chitinophagaceae bacterium]